MRSKDYCSFPMCVCVCICVCVCEFVCVGVGGVSFCLSVRRFLPPHACRSQNIGTNWFTTTQKTVIIVFLLKMLCSEATTSFACF